jgi:chromosome segregation ATPase
MPKVNLNLERKLEDFSEWNEANQRLTKLQGRLAEVERHIATLHGELSLHSEVARTDQTQQKAAALLKGDVDAALKTSRGMMSITEDLDQAHQERNTLVTAIEMLTKEINQLRGRLSQRICDAHAPEYRRLVQKQAELVRRTAETNDEIVTFLKAIEETGVSTSALRNMAFGAVGRWSDDYSRARFYLKEAREFGFIDG